MSEEMKNSFKNIDKNDKRNEFSSLLVKTEKLLDELLYNNALLNYDEVKNYDKNIDSNMNEEDMLLFFYEDLWNIKNKILELIIRQKSNERGN